MSSTNRSETCEEKLDTKSSGSEEPYQAEEDTVSEESLSESITKLKNISIQKNHIRRKKTTKSHLNRYNSSLRHRQGLRKSKHRSTVKRITSKRTPLKCHKYLMNKPETPKKGKRCRLGGKAKGKPPEEVSVTLGNSHNNIRRHRFLPSQENQDRCDSDEDGDHSYFSRISLGYFQKFRDNSGASTSYQLDECYKNSNYLSKDTEKDTDKGSEEKELLELQQWGMTGLAAFFPKSTPHEMEPDTP